MFKKVCFIGFVILSLIVSGIIQGCGMKPPAEPTATGSVRVTVKLPDNLSSPPQTRNGIIQEVIVSLTNGSTVLRQTAPIVNSAAQVSFPSVIIGRWVVAVAVKDEAGDTVYAGESEVAVVRGQQTDVNITLMPAKGRLQFRADVSGLPNQELVYKIRLYRDSTNLRSQSEFLRKPGTNVVTGEVDGIVPKVYDMMVKLYTEQGDMLYESPWEPVSIQPGKTTLLDWDFSSGGVDVVTEFDMTPPAPTGLVAEVSGEAILLTWNPVQTEENDLAGYVIYRKEFPFGGYRIIGTTAASETTFADEDTRVGVTYQYSVSAIDEGGNESARGEEISACKVI